MVRHYKLYKLDTNNGPSIHFPYYAFYFFKGVHSSSYIYITDKHSWEIINKFKDDVGFISIENYCAISRRGTLKMNNIQIEFHRES